MNNLRTAAWVAKLGDVMTDTKEEANAWKLRMLKTVQGINIPDDWPSLSEEVKEERLNKVIKFALESEPTKKDNQ